MKFFISVIDDLTTPTSAKEMAQIDQFNDELRANNQLIFAWGLEAPETATVIDNRNDAGISTGTPLFDAKENISGFWIVDVADQETAQRLAFVGSKACNRKVELRKLHGN